VSVEHVRDVAGVGWARCDDDDRDSFLRGLLQQLLVVVVHGPREDVHERGGDVERSLLPDRRGDPSARELARARDDERLVRLGGGAQLLEEPEHRSRLDRKLRRLRLDHQGARRPRPRPRAWIACRTPIATRFATIDEPPTLTIGRGMPVTVAIPIVIPTLTKTWNRNANLIPPAAIAENASRAAAIT